MPRTGKADEVGLRPWDAMTTLLGMNPYEAVRQPVPAAGDERLRALLAWAALAPSPHNTQPWRWSVRDGVIELWRDDSRLLDVSDPDGRELVIGCGCGLEHLLLRIGRDGDPVETTLLPGEPGLLARVEVGRGRPYLDRPDLVAAMVARRTNRLTYGGAALAPAACRQLLEPLVACGVDVAHVTDTAARDALVGLIMRADRAQMADPRFRTELSHWMRPRHSRHTDGMEADLLGQTGLAAYVAPLVVRTFDVGAMQAARDEELTRGSPDLFILHTTRDDEAAWLATGRGLAHLTLGATAMGRATAYMNQPCELPAAREELRAAFGLDGHPQLIVRAGAAPPVHPALRRPVAEILVPSP